MSAAQHTRTGQDEADVVVVGGGVNSLVAAAELAGAGWSVVVVEAAPHLGGFIASGEVTAPGYLHDVYSSWHPLFVTGGAYAALGADLHRHGLEYANTDGPLTASVTDDGRVSLAHRDPAATAAGFEHPEDGRAYLKHLDDFGRRAAGIGGLLGSELRSPRALGPVTALLRAGGPRDSEALLRDAATSGRDWARREFRGHEVDHLWSPWLLHAGLSPDHASGGLMMPVFAATLHGAGLPVVVGGAGRFVEAFSRLLAERGVRVITGERVERVVVEGGRAVGVSLGGPSGGSVGGQILRARKAVLASVTPSALYGSLLPAGSVKPQVTSEAEKFRHGRAAMQVHVALSGPVPWSDARLRDVPLVHVSDGSGSTGIACAQAEAGLLPARPTVVVGQQHLLDASRVPAGTAALWLQLQELPFTPSGDAAGLLDVSSGWTPELAREYAGRALDRVAQHAPGLEALVVGLHVISPVDLLAHNANAVAGDPYGGQATIDQSYLWRPLPSSGRHRTPVPGLWHIGASTHPGPGLGAGSGHLVAQTLLRPSRRPRLRRP
ncbi:Phytoene dehydrogenase-related protein [Quadrisphaera granulorum]|uniref:Pyridine nucleotide-disulfide oxidoreductase domain-containing protein 2 n=1 Tax=Quadrisphaera granulorum TaxID=317664 RepID=A0A316A6J8_9ACTN|nr:NAD(P)/FAD-dependent oxidoreductase [Quadrisphaera granulorum]PWJ53556.1 phytoene dehydrogenase-like protein [Quadrisphaera granulorum]SZE96898.1 Phytoene dehydrogenase-related protein [Quadrisphaera granulorum]